MIGSIRAVFVYVKRVKQEQVKPVKIRSSLFLMHPRYHLLNHLTKTITLKQYFCPPTYPFDPYSNGPLSNPLVFSYPKFQIFWCIYFFELQIWDVLTNKEVVDIVSSAETRSCAARAVVESAVRSWKIRYPTSKVDDCAVVCLFLTPHPNNISTASATEFDTSTEKKEPVSLKPSNGFPGDITDADDDLPDDELAEDPSTNPEDKIDWSALEGVSRVNTLLTLPRFVPEEVEKQTPGQKKTN